MWRIAQKDLKIFFTDKKALMLALLLPIGLITLFAFAFGGVVKDDDDAGTTMRVLYFDFDKTPQSIRFIQSFDSISGIELFETSNEIAVQEIKSGDEIAAIMFYKGFEDSLLAGNSLPVEFMFDKSREIEISILQNLLIGKLAGLSSEQEKKKGIERMISNQFPALSQPEKDTLRDQMLSRQATENKETNLLTYHSLVGEEGRNWGLIQAVAGTAIMMLLFSVSALGQSLLEEKENGVLKKLLQSPISPSSIMAGKMLTSTIVSVFQLCVMFLFSWLAFGLEIFMNIPALLIMIFVTALACSAFGVLLSSIVTSKKQADSLGTIIILFMSGVGGSMIPLYMMPQFMQNIAVFTVNYWSIQGFYDIFWRTGGMTSILENVLVLSGISIGILLISVMLFKKNIARLA